MTSSAPRPSSRGGTAVAVYQRARLVYQYNKLAAIRAGVYPEWGGNVEFEIFSFFEICYHLKDWIIEDPDPHPRSDVEAYVRDSPALRICADICNRLKHRRLRRQRSKSPLGLFKLTSITTIGPDPKAATVSIPKATITTERGEECCYALATECLGEWHRYFGEFVP